MLKFAKAFLYAVGAVTVAIYAFDTAMHLLGVPMTGGIVIGEIAGAVIGATWIMLTETRNA